MEVCFVDFIFDRPAACKSWNLVWLHANAELWPVTPEQHLSFVQQQFEHLFNDYHVHPSIWKFYLWYTTHTHTLPNVVNNQPHSTDWLTRLRNIVNLVEKLANQGNTSGWMVYKQRVQRVCCLRLNKACCCQVDHICPISCRTSCTEKRRRECVHWGDSQTLWVFHGESRNFWTALNKHYSNRRICWMPQLFPLPQHMHFNYVKLFNNFVLARRNVRLIDRCVFVAN